MQRNICAEKKDMYDIGAIENPDLANFLFIASLKGPNPNDSSALENEGN